MCITPFCTFLCCPCTTTTWNDQILSLLENRNGKAINSTIPVWIWARSPLFSSNQNSLLLSNRANWDKRGKVSKDVKSIFQRRFHAWTSPSSDRKVPHRKLKQRPRRRQRGRQASTLHVHHVFLYISLTTLHVYDVKLPNCTFCGGREDKTTIFLFFFFVKLDIVLYNSTPEKITNLWQTRRVGIRAMKSETAL